MNTEKKLLIGRLLSRSGDHAWDFAVPLALLHTFPGRLQVAAIYYLLTKLLMMFATPMCGRWIDRTARSRVLKVGITLQFFAVIFGGLFFWLLEAQAQQTDIILSFPLLPLFAGLLLFGVLASLGALITDISVGNDIVPSLVPSERLTWFNSWLRRADLFSEVVSPVIAGLLFAYKPVEFPLAGLFLIVLWNVLSFFPELFLLQGAVSKLPANASVEKDVAKAKLGNFWKGLLQFDFRALRQEPLALLLFSYACLWLSALSPHGVLLTGYLKDHTQLPEVEIGIFRGLGALFGLLSTFTFPYLVLRFGLLKSARWHLGFQASVLVAAAMVFASPAVFSIYWFLLFVLLSRVGLYGFMNGEFELRQRLIPSERRGQTNSYGSVLTTLATLGLYGLGSALPSTEDFWVLVMVSVGMVITGFAVFQIWSTRTKVSV